jgi:hypothetical protein
LKDARETYQITYKDKPIRITTDFLRETLEPRREYYDAFSSSERK